jgi:superfamily II DNA or RNA helicase
MILRPYQEAARQAIHGEWDQGRKRTLLVLPTGTGKTIVFAAVAEDQVRRGERVLVLAHRGELLEQAAAKIGTVSGLGCAVEKAEQSSTGSWYRITVGSVQTLMREKRLATFGPDHYGTIIVDEAHHILSDSYQRVLEHFPEANVLGVTATPDRGDMRNLGQYFDSLAYEYRITQAIKEGYLCRIKAQTIPLRLDMTGVKTQAGDYSAADVGHALDPYLEQIAAEMKTYCAGRKTVVFLPLIDTSRRFCALLQANGFRAAEVNGNSEDRAEILDYFSAGRYDVLCNSMLLTEGWDCPSVDCIVVLRPTKVRSLYCQMIGRGTRLAPGKDHLLVLDFLWHTTRHELCRPACLICENPDVAEKMTENLENSEDAIDLEAAEAMAQQDVVAEREAALAKMLEEQRHRKRALVDPLQFEYSIQAEDLATYEPAFPADMAPPTKKQLEMLERRGIFPDEITCFGKAQMIINRLLKRQEDGLTTPKQIRLLERYGFVHVGEWDFHAASSMISRISSAGWRVPRGVNPAEYRPPRIEEMEWTDMIS